MVQAQTHQTCPDVPQTPRHPDAQTPARRLPDACQTRPDAARRSRRQGSKVEGPKLRYDPKWMNWGVFHVS
eukprot:6379842-Prymnesium_polylepis.1